MSEFNEVISDTIRCNIASHGNAKFAYVCSLPKCTKVRFMCPSCHAVEHKEHQKFAIPIEDIVNGWAFQNGVGLQDKPEAEELNKLMGINEKNYLIFKRSFDKTIKDLQDYFTQVSHNLNQIVIALKNRSLQLAHDKFAANPLAQLYDYYYFFQSGGELKNIIEKYLRLVHDEGTTAFLLGRYFNSYQRDEDVIEQLKSLFEQMMNNQDKIFDDIKFEPKALDDLFAPLFHSLETIDTKKTLLMRKLQNYTLPEYVDSSNSIIEDSGFFVSCMGPKRKQDRSHTPKRRIFDPPLSQKNPKNEYVTVPRPNASQVDQIYSPKYKPYTDRPEVLGQQSRLYDSRISGQSRNNGAQPNEMSISVPGTKPQMNKSNHFEMGPRVQNPIQFRSHMADYGSQKEDRRAQTNQKQGFMSQGPKNSQIRETSPQGSDFNKRPFQGRNQENHRQQGNFMREEPASRTTGQQHQYPLEQEHFFQVPNSSRQPPKKLRGEPELEMNDRKSPPKERVSGIFTDNLVGPNPPEYGRQQRKPFDPPGTMGRSNQIRPHPNDGSQIGILEGLDFDENQPPTKESQVNPNDRRSPVPSNDFYEPAPPPVYHSGVGQDDRFNEISPITSPKETILIPSEREVYQNKNKQPDNVYHDSYKPTKKQMISQSIDEEDILVVKQPKLKTKRMQTEPELFGAVDFMNSSNTTVIKGKNNEMLRSPQLSQYMSTYPAQNSMKSNSQIKIKPNPDAFEPNGVSSGPLGGQREIHSPSGSQLPLKDSNKPSFGFNKLFQDDPMLASKSPMAESKTQPKPEESKTSPARGRSEKRANASDRERSVSASGLSVILADNNGTNYFSVRSREALIKVSKTIITSLLIYLLPHEKTKGLSEIIVCLGDNEESLLFFGEKGSFLGAIPNSVHPQNPSLISFISEENATSKSKKTFLLSLTPKSSILIISPKNMSPIKEVSIASNTPGFTQNANLITNVLVLQLKQDPKIFPNKTKTMPDPLILTSDTQKSLKVWDWNKSTRIFETFYDSEFTSINLVYLPKRSAKLLSIPNVDKFDYFTLALTASSSKKINFWSFTSDKPVFNMQCKFGGSVLSIASPTSTYSYFDDGEDELAELRREIVEKFAHILVVYTSSRDINILDWTSGELLSVCNDVHKGNGAYDCAFWLNMKPMIDLTDFLFVTLGKDQELKIWKLSEEENVIGFELYQQINVKNTPIGKNLNFLDSLITDEDNRLKLNVRLVCASANSRTSFEGVLLKTIRVLENV